MVPPRPYYPSLDPAYYAKRVLKELGLETPPTPVEPVLDYFGLRLQYLTESEAEELARRARQAGVIDAFLWLDSEPPTVFVVDSGSEGRTRMSIFHECGHFDLPWHTGAHYLCNCEDLAAHRALESDAFEFASHLLFPMETFCSDVLSFPASIATIEALSAKYKASFAATAIRYVSCHPGLCAVLYLTENTGDNNNGSSYVVRYSVKSDGFHHYWRPGDTVKGCSAIADCLRTGESVRCNAPARRFGSSRSHDYHVDVRKYGADQACVLLAMRDPQTSLL